MLISQNIIILEIIHLGRGRAQSKMIKIYDKFFLRSAQLELFPRPLVFDIFLLFQKRRLFFSPPDTFRAAPEIDKKKKTLEGEKMKIPRLIK